MKNIKKKTNELEDPAVEHFCSLYARIALQVARRCEHEDMHLDGEFEGSSLLKHHLNKKTLAVKR